MAAFSVESSARPKPTTPQVSRYFEVRKSSKHTQFQTLAKEANPHLGLERLRKNPLGHYPDPACPVLSLQRIPRGGFDGQVDLGNGRFDHHFRSGDFVLAPPNTATDYELYGTFDLDVVILSKALAEALLHDRAVLGDFGVLHDGPFRDAFLSQLVTQLFAEQQGTGPATRLFLDHAAGLILARLALLSGRRSRRTAPAAPLSPVALQQVIARIEDEPGAEHSLSGLAGLLDMPVPAFSRAFKAATGMPPYQFVLRRRIDHAVQLLRQSDLALAEVALACGFSSQQHMTDVFRSKLGTTPGQVRGETQL